MTTISQADPTAEAVKNMIPPVQSGIDYVMKRYIVEALASGNANAFAFAVQNPEGVDCVVTNVIVDITTAGGTASSVLDVDVVDAATDTGDDIIDGLDLNTTGTFDRHKNAGTTAAAHADNSDVYILRWPAPVERAALIQTARIWTRSADFEPFFVDADVDTDVRLMLDPFRKPAV